MDKFWVHSEISKELLSTCRSQPFVRKKCSAETIHCKLCLHMLEWTKIYTAVGREPSMEKGFLSYGNPK